MTASGFLVQLKRIISLPRYELGMQGTGRKLFSRWIDSSHVPVDLIVPSN